jgi:hypothetical protein
MMVLVRNFVERLLINEGLSGHDFTKEVMIRFLWAPSILDVLKFASK